MPPMKKNPPPEAGTFETFFEEEERKVSKINKDMYQLMNEWGRRSGSKEARLLAQAAAALNGDATYTHRERVTERKKGYDALSEYDTDDLSWFTPQEIYDRMRYEEIHLDKSFPRNKALFLAQIAASIKVVWDHTLNTFKKKGIRELTLYRGVAGKEYELFSLGRTLESWTDSRSTAQEFAGRKGIVLEAKIPVEAIIVNYSFNYDDVIDIKKMGGYKYKFLPPFVNTGEHEYLVFSSAATTSAYVTEAIDTYSDEPVELVSAKTSAKRKHQFEKVSPSFPELKSVDQYKKWSVPASLNAAVHDHYDGILDELHILSKIIYSNSYVLSPLLGSDDLQAYGTDGFAGLPRKAISALFVYDVVAIKWQQLDDWDIKAVTILPIDWLLEVFVLRLSNRQSKLLTDALDGLRVSLTQIRKKYGIEKVQLDDPLVDIPPAPEEEEEEEEDGDY